MRESVRYVNHLGQAVDLNAAGVRINTGELNNWELQATIMNGFVAGFTHETIERPVAGIVFKHDSAPALAKLDELYETCIVDTEWEKAGEPLYGRLVIDDWYVLCWMRAGGSGRTWLRDAADFELTLVSDIPLWTRERKQEFVADEEEERSGLDMGFDYPFDYSASLFMGMVINASPRKCPVRLTVEGPTDDWHVRMAGNVYSTALPLKEGELLVIDGRDETITHIDALGNESNAYASKSGIFEENSGSFIFQKVPPGESEIEWAGVDKVEVVVYEQRDQRPLAIGQGI